MKCLWLLLLFTVSAQARVEYALQHHITSCTACHVSALGGGVRYVDGKLYGSRFGTPGAFSKQDLVSADVRALAFYPSGGTSARQGTALMTSSAGLNVPVQKEDDGSELRAVGVYSFGVLLQGAREIYALWQSGPREETPYYVQFGRFNAPFGMPTDEHLTYTKLLTRSGIFDYEFGGVVSKDFGAGLHYDFALTNGQETGGDLNSNSPSSVDSTGAAFLNLRWMPDSIPMLFGTSAEYQYRLEAHKPYAVAAYLALSLDRATGNWLKGSVLAEGVYGEQWGDPNWNPNISRYFVAQSNTDYLNYISGVPAVAWYAQANINVMPRLVLQYKIDSLTFNPRFSGDRYLRNGFGFKYYLGSNIIIMSRYDLADAGRPDVKGSNIYAAENAFWTMFELWL